jgi:WD40 repeat protein
MCSARSVLGAWAWLIALACSCYSAPVPSREINTHSAGLLRLDPDWIAQSERRPWQPPELAAVLGSERGRHWACISQISYSPDGKLLAANALGNVYLWDASTLTFLGLLPGGAAFSRFVGARTLLTWVPTQGVRRWDLGGGEAKSTVVLRDEEGLLGNLIAVLPDGVKLAVEGRTGAELWDLSRNPPRCSPLATRCDWELLEACFSADSAQLAVLTRKSSGGRISKQAQDHRVTLWHVGTGNAEEPVPLPESGRPLAFSPEGKTLAVGQRLWTLTGRLGIKV